MTVTALSEFDVLAEFDQRVSKGVIFYDNEPKIQVQEVHGYKVSGPVNWERLLLPNMRAVIADIVNSLNLP